MSSLPRRPSAPDPSCAGKVHVDRQLPAILDLQATRGPSRVALIEDGAMFCASCAHELGQGGRA
jgi:hypothetical protein